MSDPLDPIRDFLRAHSLRELAKGCGVPYKTIHNWMKRGTPLAIRQGMKVLAYVKRRRPKKAR